MPLGAAHRRHLVSVFRELDRRLAELEAQIAQAARPNPFSPLAKDVSPTEAKVIVDHLAHLRRAILAHLETLGIKPEVRRASLRWTLQSSLMHLRVEVDDMGPKAFARYGPLEADAAVAIGEVQEDLTRLLDQVLAAIR